MKDLNLKHRWQCPGCGYRMDVNVENENVYSSKKQFGFSVTVVCPQCGLEQRLYKLNLANGVQVMEG